MQSTYRLELKDDPDLEALLYGGINDEAAKKKGMSRSRSFGVCIRDHNNHVLGGTKGVTLWGNLYVDALWIDKRLRQQGWGTKLIAEAEKIGRERGCTFATLNTMDWEALPFYQKLGYTVEFTREGFENDSRMYMLRKTL